MPLVSVVMPVYNSEKFVAEAIDSILGQTLTDFEFIIVDDGSTDSSPAIIQSRAQQDPRIRFIQHAENRGHAAARNTGMERVSGRFITGMDSDDISLPLRFERQAACLEAHPEIGAVGTFYRKCDEDLSPLPFVQLPSRHPVMALHLVLFTRIVMKSSPMMSRCEFLDRRPLYDPALIVSPDVELYLRLMWEKGIRFYNLPEELYLYRRHGSTQFKRHRAIQRKVAIEIRSRALRQLGEPGLAAEWILHKHPLTKLSWRERSQARRDIGGLIAAMVAQDWVDAADEPLLHAEMEKLLESTSPRRWQMLLHWYRHRVARHIQP